MSTTTVISRRIGRGLALLLLFLPQSACLHQTGPEDPSPLPAPLVTSVRIEYRQPNGCLNTTSDCGGAVTFFASWLPEGAYLTLLQAPGTFVWTGTADNVPVNFPPTDQPYVVRVGDPFLRDYQTAGATADRLRVGGQVLSRFLDYGTPNERGLVYIDAQGVGHNPF
jgi:hypothetical protein